MKVYIALSTKGSNHLSASNTLVLVNGVEVSALDGDSTELSHDDEVVLIPVIHGG